MKVLIGRLAIISVWVIVLAAAGAPKWAAIFGAAVLGYLAAPERAP